VHAGMTVGVAGLAEGAAVAAVREARVGGAVVPVQGVVVLGVVRLGPGGDRLLKD
jgi:hypothetical protein